MNFKKAIRTISNKLKEHNPEKFSSSWIFKHAPYAYNYLRIHCRTETDDIDWDRITIHLSRTFQRRWTRYRRRPAKSYENQDELDRVLIKHKERMYTFLAPANDRDRKYRNRIIISLVRVAQKGNMLAQNEVVSWVRYIVDDWIDKYWQISKWRGYPDEVDDKIRGCVRCYKYTGSFIGYLFKTLEFSARGKPPECSLDDPIFDGEKTRIDFVIQESEMSRFLEK